MLTDNYKGQKFSFLNNLDVAKDGRVYFTDSSTKYNLHGFLLDMLEGKPYGRVYMYDPSTE